MKTRRLFPIRRLAFLLVTFGLFIFLPTASAASVPAAPEKLINSFETPAEVAAMQGTKAKLQPTSDHATHGRQALRVEFNAGSYPNVKQTAVKPWDWRGGNLAIDITNPTNEPIQFCYQVESTPVDGKPGKRVAEATIEPNSSAAYVMPLVLEVANVGMQGLPSAAPGAIMMRPGPEGALDLEHITSYQIYLRHPQTPKVLIIDRVRLVATSPLDKIVDPFGQYTGFDWPGKLKSADEFAPRRAAEEADLRAHPPATGFDAFGGWLGGPKLQPGPCFRAERANGKWWLVTPEGHLFFSKGMDSIRPTNPTMVSGREHFFTWLPAKNDPLAAHLTVWKNPFLAPGKEGLAIDFYEANLHRKYGNDYKTVWRDVTLARLKSWGFNTIGVNTVWTFSRGSGLAYLASTSIDGPYAHFIPPGNNVKMHDPFDPGFARAATAAITKLAADVKDDPHLLGYVIDNELPWGNTGTDAKQLAIALGVLGEDASKSSAKQALLAELKVRHKTIAALNTAWATSFKSWEELAAPCHPKIETPSEQLQADLTAYTRSFARQYFRIVRDELKKADPKHLYLGCRFAVPRFTRPIAEVAAEFCDVVTFNIYQPRIETKEWGFLDAYNKPCLITEFHMGALDRGMFHPSLVATPSQQARAAMYQDYVRSVMENPTFVGCYWFRYANEPLTGNPWDGENYDCGFVTAVDFPHPEMVEAARQVNAETYTRRGK